MGPLDTLHSVTYVAYEERARDNKSCRTLIPSFRGLRKERLGLGTACIALRL